MKDVDAISLLDGNYPKVLDIMGKVFKNSKEVKTNYNKVNKLTWNLKTQEDKDKVFKGFKVVWESAPKDLFRASSLDELNLRINQFSRYVVETNDEYADHGFSLLVTYYLLICDTFLNETTYNNIMEGKNE